MREKEYIVTIGSANMDVAGYSHASKLCGFESVKDKIHPGGVGRNIAHNLALLGKNSWLLTAVGNDFMDNRYWRKPINPEFMLISVLSFPERIRPVIYHCLITPVKCWLPLMI